MYLIQVQYIYCVDGYIYNTQSIAIYIWAIALLHLYDLFCFENKLFFILFVIVLLFGLFFFFVSLSVCCN